MVICEKAAIRKSVSCWLEFKVRLARDKLPCSQVGGREVDAGHFKSTRRPQPYPMVAFSRLS